MKDGFDTRLSLDNVDSKSHYFSCCEYELQFIKVCRKMDYSSKLVTTIDEMIVMSFSSNTSSICLEMGNRLVETLYYISGWTIVALRKIADRRKEEVALCIRYFCNTCCTIGSVAKDKGLPTGKVDRVMAFGSLTFVNSDYFKFITRMENVFVHCLSYEHLSLYGSFLIERIKNALLNHDQVVSDFTMFVPDNVSNEISLTVLSLLLTLYSRMRGKDFSMKLLRKHASLKTSTRANQAVISNPKTYGKKNQKNKTIIDILDDDLDRNDHASFQNIFCDLTDDIIEEHDD